MQMTSRPGDGEDSRKWLIWLVRTSQRLSLPFLKQYCPGTLRPDWL